MSSVKSRKQRPQDVEFPQDAECPEHLLHDNIVRELDPEHLDEGARIRQRQRVGKIRASEHRIRADLRELKALLECPEHLLHRNMNEIVHTARSLKQTCEELDAACLAVLKVV